MRGLEKLLGDCRLLFEHDVEITGQFLESLGMQTLKSAFRRKALVTHPDLFSNQAPSIQRHHADLFIGASEAYKRLSQFVLRKSSGSRASGSNRPYSSTRQASRTRPSHSEWPAGPGEGSPHEGFRRPAAGRIYSPHDAPGWPLRTGEYLYFSKAISWKLLIEAIVWQRRQRERIGDVARRWGWLSEEKTREITSKMILGEKFGEALLRHEWLTPYQLRLLLTHQSMLQLPIGRFFVERGIFSESDIRAFLADLDAHNRRCRRHPGD